MSSPYPTHIKAPVRYTPTVALEHSQLMRLYELAMPAIEDLSWEDVATSSVVKLKEYSNVYGARAEGLRLPRCRAELETFFTALLHARHAAPSSVSKQVQLKSHEEMFDSKSKIHPNVRELALENGLGFHLSQRYEIDTVAAVVQFASEEGGKWADESTALSAAVIMEEIANAAERKVTRVTGASEGKIEMSGALDCLRSSGPWKGWCGFRSGMQRK